MGRHAKLFERLDQLEADLRARLVPMLRLAADGRHDLVFAAARVLPESYPRHMANREMDELLGLADEILSLRAKLDSPDDDGIAPRLHAWCAKWADRSDHHRGNPARMARELLAELDAKSA